MYLNGHIIRKQSILLPGKEFTYPGNTKLFHRKQMEPRSRLNLVGKSGDFAFDKNFETRINALAKGQSEIESRQRLKTELM